MIENNKTRENINDLNISEEEEREEKDNSNKKKKLKTYKFHILHHNGILNALKKNGINANQVFKENQDLITDLIKFSEYNNKTKPFKKSISEVSNQNFKNKNNSKKYSNATNYFCNKKFQIQNGNKTSSNKKSIKINRHSIKSLFNKNLKINKRFSLDENNHFNNSVNNLNECNNSKEKSKEKRISADQISNKIYLSFDEDNNINNEEQSQKVNDSNSNIPSKFNEKMNKLKQSNKINQVTVSNNRQKSIKRNNSIFTHISNYSNNNFFQRNITRYNKHFYTNNNKKFMKKKRNNSLQPYYIKGSVNFKKMLSRAYINKLKAHVDNIYSTITPNYFAVEPKCIMKVTYKNRKYNCQRPPFKGLSADFTFDMDKIYFKYNNHIPPKTFVFHKLTGRDYNSEKKLPSFMIGQFNRNSVNTLNEKNLIMNCYSNGQLKQSKSSFNDKKSFNYVLNYQNNKSFNENQIEFDNLVKTIMEKGIVNNDDKKFYNNDGNKKENEMVNSIPFRIKSMFKNFMSEYKRDINPRNNIIDGITFKSFNIFSNDRNKFSKGYNNF